METEIFTLADFAADYGSGKLSVIGTFDHIYGQTFPFVHPSCALATRIRLTNSDAGQHDLEFVFRGPDDLEFLPRIRTSMNFVPLPDRDYGTLNIVLNLTNTRFARPGHYAIEFHFDGEFRSGLHLNVVQPTAVVRAA